MTGTDLYKRTHKSVPVIFEPPCILEIRSLEIDPLSLPHRHCTQCGSSGPYSRFQICYTRPAVLTSSWFASVSVFKWRHDTDPFLPHPLEL